MARLAYAAVAALVLSTIRPATASEPRCYSIYEQISVMGFPAAQTKLADALHQRLQDALQDAVRPYVLRQSAGAMSCGPLGLGTAQLEISYGYLISGPGPDNVNVDFTWNDCVGGPITSLVLSKPVTTESLSSVLARDFQVELRARLESKQPELSSLEQYGAALRSGEKSAYFNIAKSRGGASVTFVAAQGTAAAADLRVGDQITSINGIPLQPLDQEQILALIRDINSDDGSFALTVLRASRQLIVKFESRSAAWYSKKVRN